MPLRTTLSSLALGVSPIQAQNSVDPSGTAAQTVKPPAGNGMTVNKPSGASTAESPTVTQTVKPRSSAKPRQKMKRNKASTMPATDTSSVGSGSGGTAAGRVENSTNSNEKGQPGKAP